MSDHLPSAESTPPTRELRIALVDPVNRVIASQDFASLALIQDIAQEGEITSHEYRATHIGQRLPNLGAPALSAMRHLGAIDGIPGYMVRPVTGAHINFRHFSLKKYEFDEVLDAIENNSLLTNPTDLEFITRALDSVKRSANR